MNYSPRKDRSERKRFSSQRPLGEEEVLLAKTARRGRGSPRKDRSERKRFSSQRPLGEEEVLVAAGLEKARAG
jgi:hypothetical protein